MHVFQRQFSSVFRDAVLCVENEYSDAVASPITLKPNTKFTSLSIELVEAWEKTLELGLAQPVKQYSQTGIRKGDLVEVRTLLTVAIISGALATVNNTAARLREDLLISDPMYKQMSLPDWLIIHSAIDRAQREGLIVGLWSNRIKPVYQRIIPRYIREEFWPVVIFLLILIGGSGQEFFRK